MATKLASASTSGPASTSTNADSKVRVEFTTKHDQYRIPQTGMLLPASLRRYGLSEVVNHILGRETPVPFDFLVDGQFLRTSIAEYLVSNAISLETTLVLEYFPSARPPTEIGSFPHPDWVSSVSGNGSAQIILTGCYDGIARVWNKSGECVAMLEGTEAPIKAVRWWYPRDSSDKHCFTSGADQSITAWQVGDSWKPSVVFRCVGHASSVDGLDVSPDSRYLASASFDGTAKLWTTSADDIAEDDAEDTSRVKRRKGEAAPTPRKAALRTFEGHTAGVNCVVFDRTGDAKLLVTGSADHSIRQWDLDTGFNTRTMTTDKVVNALDVSRSAGLIVSGHSDRVIRIWDARTSEANTTKLRFSGHQNWVSAVKWSLSNPYVFASGSYDSTVKIWDIRSDTPLFSAAGAAEDHKVLALDWVDNLIFASGSDTLLHALEFQA